MWPRWLGGCRTSGGSHENSKPQPKEVQCATGHQQPGMVTDRPDEESHRRTQCRHASRLDSHVVGLTPSEQAEERRQVVPGRL